MAHKETCNKTKISIISSRYLVILKTHLSKQKWGSSNLNCVKICASHTYLFVCCFFFFISCFQNKIPFDRAVQTTGDSWHFPAKDGKQWLCVRKEETFSALP